MENSTTMTTANVSCDLSDTTDFSHAEHARQILKEKGLRITRDRVLVLADLMKTKNPVSHTVLFDKLKKQGLHMDRVTLYRILDWLTENNLVHRLSGEDRTWRFSYCPTDSSTVDGGVHAHFYCKKCGSYTCLHNVPLSSSLHIPEGFSQTEVELTVTGVCPTCVVKQ